MTTENESELLARQALSHLRVAHACLQAAIEDDDVNTSRMFASDAIYESVNEARDNIKREIRKLTQLLHL